MVEVEDPRTTQRPRRDPGAQDGVDDGVDDGGAAAVSARRARGRHGKALDSIGKKKVSG